jgi:hypothetical protein
MADSSGWVGVRCLFRVEIDGGQVYEERSRCGEPGILTQASPGPRWMLSSTPRRWARSTWGLRRHTCHQAVDELTALNQEMGLRWDVVGARPVVLEVTRPSESSASHGRLLLMGCSEVRTTRKNASGAVGTAVRKPQP